MVEELAAGFERWIRAQTLFTPAPMSALTELVDRFYHDWLQSPFRSPTGGSRLNNLLWLCLLARAYEPKVIIDSGAFQGASAWALALGAPAARVYSFDIDLSQLKRRTSGVRYIEEDWIRFDPDWQPGDRVLAYFDDHVDQARRLIEAADRGVGLLIFDDDYPLTSFHQMAPSPNVLPKIEFLLSPHLKDLQTLQWRYGGKLHTWTAEGALLENARRRIKATERLPFTGLTTNIMQTPYRLVVPQ
ncbi:MAG: hypothetical protein K2X34_02010 [Hyphomonadaceae bacterium]|nr:hypothetical protein [Hyphomonadaceae bacterium]